MISLQVIAFFVFAFFCLSSSEKLGYHSFEPPFTDVDSSGLKQVNNHWRISGSTIVQNNFLRLTPDRQSKKGSLWSRKALGVPSINAIVKFRISGQVSEFKKIVDNIQLRL